MVNYGLHRRQKSKESSSSVRATNASMVSSSSASTASISSFSDALTDDSSFSNDPYFHFSTDQQDALLDESRSTATALIVDTLSGFDKWRFLTTTSKVQLFELKQDAADRVSSMLSDDPQQLQMNQSHTLLGITRVRAKLDDFMRIVATDKRDKFQNFLGCLHEANVQHADVFTAFGSVHSNHNSSHADVLSSSFTSNSSLGSSRTANVDMEQYAIKYFSLKAPKVTAPSSRNGMVKKFGRKGKSSRGSSSSSKSSSSSSTCDGGLTFCLGEYATIRRGKIRPTSQQPQRSSSSRPIDDHRIGIVACHSVGDPQVTRYCKPIASTTGSGFAVTTRSFAQFSGVVVYPVESSVPGESLLEVVVKLSCFDPQGISSLKKQAMMEYLVAYRNLENALLVLRLHDSPFLSSANWVKSESRKCCNVCQQSFPSFRRKHHCRLCGEVTCSKCSSMHQIKLAKAGKCAFRICATCLHGAGDATQQHKQVDSGPEEEEEEEEVELLERDTRLHHHLQLEQPPERQRERQLEPQQQQQQQQPLLHKEQLQQHNSRHHSRREEEDPALEKQRAESTASSGESEFYDSRGFLASNVTATTAASTPPSTTASPLSSSPISPSAVVHSDNFYTSKANNSNEEEQRFSEQSIRDFHDSEFDLDIKGMHWESTVKKSMVFGIDEEDFDDEEEEEAFNKQQPVRLSELQTESQPESQPEHQPESQPEPQPEHQPEPQPEHQVEPQPQQEQQLFLHKEQLEQHTIRYQQETPVLEKKQRAESAASSVESEGFDSRGFLASNAVTPTQLLATASPASPVVHHEDFYSSNDYNGDEKDERFSEQSFRDFHDSEFDLDISGLHLGNKMKGSDVFGIDEEDSDEEEEESNSNLSRNIKIPSSSSNNNNYRHYDQHYGSLDEEDDEDEDGYDDDNGFEFHDSEIGIEFTFQEIEEFNDSKYEAIEEEIQEINTTSAAMLQRNRLLDELRRTRLMDYDIMDSSKEQAFDMIATQAAQFMSCSLASISFIDDKREFIKAASGAQVLRTNINEISKQHSLAAHIVQRCAADDLSMVVVLDARHDEALSTNLFVYDAPYLRFVVGIPIKTRDGVVLGALVVADDRPRREVTLTESTVLKDFGEQVNDLMEERWQRRMYERRAAPAPEQIQQTLQSLLSQSYHTGQQLRQQQVERQNFHRSLPPPRPHPQRRQVHHHHHNNNESIHGRLTMQGIEL